MAAGHWVLSTTPFSLRPQEGLKEAVLLLLTAPVPVVGRPGLSASTLCPLLLQAAQAFQEMVGDMPVRAGVHQLPEEMFGILDCFQRMPAHRWLVRGCFVARSLI